MNTKNFLKSLGIKLCIILSTIFFSSGFICNAENPSVVSGRVLEAGKKTEDKSNWIEIARYRNYSLIMRVDPISKSICFDDSGRYCGYSDSNAQRKVNRWFDELNDMSALKKYAVGNTAFTNLGCFGELNEYRFKNVYENLRSNEAMGTGISLPLASGEKRAFLLSYQEALSYISCDSKDYKSEILTNYQLLKERSLLKTGKLILDSWLRSPGMYSSTCAYMGNLFLTGTINSASVKHECFVRPCLWVKSSFFCDDESVSDKSIEMESEKAEKIQQPLEKILQPLDSMIGMKNFKEIVQEIILREKAAFLDEQAGMNPEKSPISMVLTGNPGTGKTTVAEKFCEILYNAGLINKKNLIKVEKKDLVGKYVGHTEANVKKILEKAEGGVLFIDEAYTLVTGGDSDFGQHVIDGILTAMTENKCVIIVAGYPEPMEEFIRSNPGLSSRFRQHINLENYSSEELFQMFKNLCIKSGFKLEDENITKSILIEHFKTKLFDKNFGNGRYVGNFFTAVKGERAKLISTNPPTDRTVMKVEYILKAIEKDA